MNKSAQKLISLNKKNSLFQIISLVSLWIAIFTGVIFYFYFTKGNHSALTLPANIIAVIFYATAIIWWVSSIPVLIISVYTLNKQNEITTVPGLSIPIYAALISGVTTITATTIVLLTIPSTVATITSVMALNKQNKILAELPADISDEEEE